MKTLYHLKAATCLKAALVASTLIALPVSAVAQQLDVSVNHLQCHQLIVVVAHSECKVQTRIPFETTPQEKE